MENRKIDSNKILSFSIVLVFVVAIGIIIYSAFASPDNKDGNSSVITEFSNNWNYHVNGEVETINLPYTDVPSTIHLFTISKRLPELLPKDAVIYLKINHNVLNASVGNTQLQIKGVYQNRTMGTSTSAMWATIYLEPEYAGKIITLSITETNGISGINFGDVIITNHNNLTRSLLRKNILTIILFVSMETLSLILFSIGMIFRRKKIGFSYEIFLSLSFFIFLSALWVFLDSSVLDVYFEYNDYQYFSSFFTFMLMPIPFVLFIREMLSTGKRVFNGILVLFVIAFLVSATLLISGVIPSLIWVLIVFHVLIVLGVFAAVGFSVYDYVKYRKKHVQLILWGTLFIGFFSVIALCGFYKGNSTYTSMFRIGLFGFVLFLSLSAIRYVTAVANIAAESDHNQKKAQKAQNNLRVSQIGTHFFYHVMNTTRVLIKTNPDVAYKMLGDISKYLRYKTDSSEIVGSLVKFSDEMKSIRAYVNMKQVLLGDRLSVVYEISIEDFYVPVLSIQPLVENAIKHGIEPKESGGTVTITVNEDNDFYIVAVEDDGVGFDQELMIDNKQISVSQANIKERLGYYGNNKISICSTPNHGTKIEVKFLKELEKIYENDIS